MFVFNRYDVGYEVRYLIGCDAVWSGKKEIYLGFTGICHLDPR